MGIIRSEKWSAAILKNTTTIGGMFTHFVHDSSLLLQRHGDGVLMTVAVQANFVAGVGDHAALFRERLERVAGDEPGGFDVVLFEHLEEAADTDRSGEEAWDYLSVDLLLEKWTSCIEAAVFDSHSRLGTTYRERCRWCCPRLRTSLASRRRRRCRRRYNIGPLDWKSALWNE